MDKIPKEKIKLTTRQILLYLVDGLVAAQKPFDKYRIYKKTFRDYEDWRDFDKKRFSDNLKRLEREGIIKIYLDQNKGLLELTKKGKNKVEMIIAKKMTFKYPRKWDYKWRMVIFDIPNRKKKSRDIFRWKLKEIGFYPLQESVFVFPFDCKDLIDYFKSLLGVSSHIQYVIAETIETQINLVDKFVKRGLLDKKMLKDKEKE